MFAEYDKKMVNKNQTTQKLLNSVNKLLKKNHSK